MSLFVTLEGIDGSGKTTQIGLLEQWLHDEEYDVLVRREPGGTELGEAIRRILLDPQWKQMTSRTEYFLYSASRAQLVDEVIQPHLEKPRSVVILDRYADSSTAYQGGGRELGIEAIEGINRFATGDLTPDVTLVFDLDWETSLARRSNLHPDRLEQNAREFFERVRSAYIMLCERNPERYFRVDASRPAATLFTQIQTILWEWL